MVLNTIFLIKIANNK